MDTLPPEINILILSSVQDIGTLRSLAHVSSSFHQAYMRARDDIFRHLLFRILDANGVDIVDSLATLKASQLHNDTDGRNTAIHEFIERYWHGFKDDKLRLTFNDCVAILSLHRKFLALIDGYCVHNIIQNPLSARGPNPCICTEPLQELLSYSNRKVPEITVSERQRIYRAICRWELYSRLFGGSSLERKPDYSEFHLVSSYGFPVDEENARRLFLTNFPIHEVEEIACLHSYAKHLYEACISPLYIDNVIALGPILLHGVLRTPRREWSKMLEPHFKQTGLHIRCALDEYEQIVDGGSWPWRGMNNPLNHDRVPTDGWLWASARGPENTDLKLRRWGYVFWDRERLDDWGVIQETMLHWCWSYNPIPWPE